jgi:histone acetyltransferase (RNA polymerase elongator complex component)
MQEALLATAKEYLDRGEISSLRLSTRPDAIDDAVLDRLCAYGVETIELGAQSLDDEVLLLSGRGHTAADVENASRLIKSRGFKLILQMMTGLPGDTPEKDIETARKIIALKPDGVRIYPTVIVRDTALYDMWQAGSYPEHTVEDAVQVCAKLLPMFQEAGIPVIRLGLNPTDDLSGGDAAAGAYHPALGEMVKSRIMLHKARELLSFVEAGSSVVLEVGRGKASQMIGQKRGNIGILMDEFALKGLKVKENPALSEEIRILSVEK